MATMHLEYSLPIFCADQGEAPVKGAFFATTKGSNLSKIAKAVYGDSSAWKILNMNAWNRDNLVYRADSADCSSEKRDSVAALTTLSPNTSAKSAYISLCQRDIKMVPTLPLRAFFYPVIWIPDPDKMINPVKPSEEPETDPVGPGIKLFDKDTIKVTPKDVIKVTPFKPAGGGSGGGSGSGSKTTTGGSSVKPASKTAGIGLVLGGLAMLAALIFWPKKKGK